MFTFASYFQVLNDIKNVLLKYGECDIFHQVSSTPARKRDAHISIALDRYFSWNASPTTYWNVKVTNLLSMLTSR